VSLGREYPAQLLLFGYLSPGIAHNLRIKITKLLRGSIDGIQLNRFETGRTYDVGTTLGNCLLSMGAGVPVDDEHHVQGLRLDEVAKLLFKPNTVSDAAEDRPKRVKRKRKRRPRVEGSSDK